MNWDEYFIKMADLVSLKSKDRSIKIGCVLVGEDHSVLGTGFNGFPRGVNDDIDARHDRPLKYSLTSHAELNSITNCARNGVKTLGATLYLNCGPNACADCSRAIIQAGIKAVVGMDVSFEGKGAQWEESCRIGRDMFEEAGIQVIRLDEQFRRVSFSGPVVRG